MKNMFKRSVAVVLFGAVLSVALPYTGAAKAASNASPTATAEPNPASNPVLANIMRLGTKIYYLGTRGGLDGWLILKNGQIQIAYTLPGGQDMMMGALFGPNGENVSSAQIQSVLDAHPDVKNMLITTAGQQTTGANAGGNTDMAAAVASAAATARAEIARANGNMAAIQAAASTLAPGERLMKDLQDAAGVTVGDASAPLLLMVMDPTCPHCRKTWEMLRDKIFAKALQVRLVPIARNASDAEQERAAAQLLHSADPLNVLDRYESGDKSQLAGTPDAGFLQAVRNNHQLIDSWHIDHTPFLVYRAKDGQVKIVQGEPDQPTAIFKDLLP